MKILLALGSDPVGPPLAFALQELGWAVVQDLMGEDAVALVDVGDCDAVLLDMALPGARSIVEDLRTAARDLAIMVIGHAPTLTDLERMFAAGADDVLAHPVVPLEILLRAQAITRRRHGHARDVIRFGAFTVLPGSHAEAAGVHLRFTPSEFKIVERLALRAGRIVGRDALMSAIHGGPDEPCAKVVDVFLCRIRKMMAVHGLPADLITTVWGRGWRLPAPFAEGAHGALTSQTSRQLRMARPARGTIGRAA